MTTQGITAGGSRSYLLTIGAQKPSFLERPHLRFPTKQDVVTFFETKEKNKDIQSCEVTEFMDNIYVRFWQEVLGAPRVFEFKLCPQPIGAIRPISKKNEAILDAAHRDYGLNLEYLRGEYGLEHTLKLYKTLLKESAGETPLSYPKHMERSEENIANYIGDLQHAGLKIRTWAEDFVDEDTGEIVTITRQALVLPKKKNTPN